MTHSPFSFHDHEDDYFAVGLSDRNSNHYKHRRNVLDITNKLHSYGLQHRLDLPQIVVIGSQSAGKSSLIEAISKITLPRDTGTCTRCPIECRLTRTTTDWSCEVYLRMDGNEKEICFGPLITEKAEVEDRIRRAQLAVLNPNKPPDDFLGALGDIDSGVKNENSFTSNVVSVRVSGREMDDLSFVDLPGIIADVLEGGKVSDIEEVESLVRDVIKRPSCLILLVTSCTMELELQGARRLAKNADRLGHRTIPVLTKPDRIEAGLHSRWLKLLSNEEERCQHGWYCVKQPNQQELENRISWEEARKNEVEFFTKTAPWKSLEYSLTSRLGTAPLIASLGGILFDLICKRLPSLVKEVEKKVEDLREEIAKLPKKPVGDPVLTVMNMVESFKRDVELLVKGRPEAGRDGLIQTLRRSKENFREAIFAQAPDFRPFSKPTNLIEIPLDTAETAPQKELPGQATEEPLEPVRTKASVPPLYVDEVLNIAHDAITRELPNHCPYEIYVHFINRTTERWHIPARKFFEEMKHHFMKGLKALVSQHFSKFSMGGLGHHIQRTVMEQLEKCSHKASGKMEEWLELEREEPATVNELYLGEYRRRFHAKYTAKRRLHDEKKPKLQNFLKGVYDTDVMNEAMYKLSQMGFDGLRSEDLLRLLPSQRTDLAVEIMSEVRAYYQVAFKRFVDNIPMILDHELLKGLLRTLTPALYQDLQIVGKDAQDRCATYLKEDPKVIRYRETLEQDLRKFEAALYDLRDIPGIDSIREYEEDADSGTDYSD